MEKANIAPFQIGDKVIYITGISMPKNSIHEITGLHIHACGCWAVAINNIPFREMNVTTPMVRCIICYDVHSSRHYKIDGWAATSFRKVSEQPMKKLTFKEIEKVETEEVICLN